MLGHGYTITRSVTGYIILILLLLGLWFGAILIKIGICGIRAAQVGKKTSILDFLFLGDFHLKNHSKRRIEEGSFQSYCHKQN